MTACSDHGKQQLVQLLLAIAPPPLHPPPPSPPVGSIQMAGHRKSPFASCARTSNRPYVQLPRVDALVRMRALVKGLAAVQDQASQGRVQVCGGGGDVQGGEGEGGMTRCSKVGAGSAGRTCRLGAASQRSIWHAIRGARRRTSTVPAQSPRRASITSRPFSTRRFSGRST